MGHVPQLCQFTARHIVGSNPGFPAFLLLTKICFQCSVWRIFREQPMYCTVEWMIFPGVEFLIILACFHACDIVWSMESMVGWFGYRTKVRFSHQGKGETRATVSSAMRLGVALANCTSATKKVFPCFWVLSLAYAHGEKICQQISQCLSEFA